MPCSPKWPISLGQSWRLTWRQQCVSTFGSATRCVETAAAGWRHSDLSGCAGCASPNHSNDWIHACCPGFWTLAVLLFLETGPGLSLGWEGAPQSSHLGHLLAGPGACCQPLDGAERDSWLLGWEFSTFWEIRCSFSFQSGSLRMPFCTWLFIISTSIFLGGFIISCLPQCWVEVSHWQTRNIERLKRPLFWASIYWAEIRAPRFRGGSLSDCLIASTASIPTPNCSWGCSFPGVQYWHFERERHITKWRLSLSGESCSWWRCSSHRGVCHPLQPGRFWNCALSPSALKGHVQGWVSVGKWGVLVEPLRLVHFLCVVPGWVLDSFMCVSIPSWRQCWETITSVTRGVT